MTRQSRAKTLCCSLRSSKVVWSVCTAALLAPALQDCQQLQQYVSCIWLPEVERHPTDRQLLRKVPRWHDPSAGSRASLAIGSRSRAAAHAHAAAVSALLAETAEAAPRPHWRVVCIAPAGTARRCRLREAQLFGAASLAPRLPLGLLQLCCCRRRLPVPSPQTACSPMSAIADCKMCLLCCLLDERAYMEQLLAVAG